MNSALISVTYNLAQLNQIQNKISHPSSALFKLVSTVQVKTRNNYDMRPYVNMYKRLHHAHHTKKKTI